MNLRVSATGRRVWVGGFNLLPYRQRDARRARRRCLAEWLGAALCGCAAVFAIVGWQAFERVRVDAQRISTERELARLAAPLAEHTKLQHDADERSKRSVRAVALSAPLTRLLDLFDTLSHVSGDGVILQQLRQRGHQTDLLATSVDPVGPALWLKQLSTVRGVKSAEVADLHPVARAGLGVAASGAGPIEFAAKLHWDEGGEKAARAEKVPPGSPDATARRPVGDSLRGAR